MKKFLVVALLAVTALCALGLAVLANLPAFAPGRTSQASSPEDATAELRQMLGARSQAALDAEAAARTIPPPELVDSVANVDWWTLPLPEVIERLLALAEAGDMEAAYALGSRSAGCMETLRKDSPENLLEAYRRDITIDLGRPRTPEQQALWKLNTDRQFASRLKRYEDCAVLDEAVLADHLQWLERAGASGLDKAQLAYAQYASAEYEDDRGALIADIEEATRRRERAAEWLRRLVADGNEQALSAMVESPDISGLAADPEALMSYRYVLDLVRSRRVGKFEALWGEGPTRYGDEFTTQQWNDIAARGRRIFKEDFEDAPLWPGR